MINDYTQAGVAFKVRKAIRYVRLYGVSRTLVKVKAQYHMKTATEFAGARWENPRCRHADAPRRNVAIIGCGSYSFSAIAYYLAKRDSRFLRVTYDINKSRALSLCKAYGGRCAVSDWRQIVDDPGVRIVYIASNHASHAEYAVACIEAGKHVHIEKPHAVTYEQLERLVAVMRQHRDAKVFMGFNRPRSPLFRKLQEYLSREPGSLMINWFIAGHEIPDGHWYFDKNEGGRVLGNLCHWTDLTLHLVSMEKAFPCRIVPATPVGATSDFVVSIMFADRSCASITFSAKGHTFEGVREVLNVHKGNLLATLTDFQTLTLDVVEKKQTIRLRHRDYGHELNFVHSLDGAADDGVAGEHVSYVGATGQLFLAIRRAIDSGEPVDVSWEDINGHEAGNTSWPVSDSQQMSAGSARA